MTDEPDTKLLLIISLGAPQQLAPQIANGVPVDVPTLKRYSKVVLVPNGPA